jgi:hypothetical protein
VGCYVLALRHSLPLGVRRVVGKPLALLDQREPALGAAYLAPSASAACATVGQTVAPLEDSPLGALFVLRGG